MLTEASPALPLVTHLVFADREEIDHGECHGDGRGVGVVGHGDVSEGDHVALPDKFLQRRQYLSRGAVRDRRPKTQP